MAFWRFRRAMAETNFDIQLLEDQIAKQIELVAQLICENKSAVEAERELERLERQLVEEIMRLKKASSGYQEMTKGRRPFSVAPTTLPF